MALETTTVRAELNGDGSAGPFQCGFRVLNASDVKVYVDGSATAKTLTTHYTVANAGTTSNATVTFTAGNFPQAGTKNVVLVREVPYTQPSNYQNNTALDAETLEASFDRATMQAQQSTEKIDRALKFSDTATEIDASVTEISAPADSRKNKYIGFDDSGNMSLSDAVSNPLITSTNPQAGDMLRYNGSKYVNTPIKDEDDMASNSDAHVPSQQSVKAYVDAQIATEDTIAELNDTTITSLADNHVLSYDNSDGKWKNQTPSDAGLIPSSDLLDEDNMATNSATKLASQQSIKAYVDNSSLSIIDEDNMATDSNTRPPSQQSVKAYVNSEDALYGYQGEPHIIPGVLYPGYNDKRIDGTTDLTASTTGPGGSTVASSKYGTVQGDGRMYYYTDIKGSKPIKDPRIGAHFGSQRHKFKSMQLLEQETATHGKKVYSVDGREWLRFCGTYLEQNGSNGHVFRADTEGSFLEITGYFNQFNFLEPLYQSGAPRNRWIMSVDGTATVTESSNPSSVDNPLGGRYVDNASLRNFATGITQPRIITIKMTENSNDTNNWMSGCELIAQDTSNRNNIQIPSQDVVSYGKKFTVNSSNSGFPATGLHYNPFAFKTDGSSAWDSGAHNGTSLPVGTGSSHNIDTATSLGLENWKHTDGNYYKPYNGGRVVFWIDNTGVLKTSVTVMPPLAKSMADSNNLTPSALSNNIGASSANSEYRPYFGQNDAYDASGKEAHGGLDEVTKTFHFRELGNGSANGNTDYSDPSTLVRSAGTHNTAFVMDDGLTSLSCFNMYDYSDYGLRRNDAGDVYFTFIGTGLTIKGKTYTTTVAQNLPYGTHIFRQLANGSSGSGDGGDWFIDGVKIKTFSGASGTVNQLGDYGILELTIHQPKKPLIDEDSCILADFMLVADFVPQATAGIEYIPKGVRFVAQSKDYKIDYTAGSNITSPFKTANLGFRTGQYFWWKTSNASGDTYTQELPFFGDSFVCHFTTQSDSDYADPVVTLNGSALSGFTNTYNGSGVQAVSSAGVIDETGSAGDDNVVNFKAGTGTLGANTLKVSITSNQQYKYAYNRHFSVATPIHTSSHYQSFETPFLNELVGGDRNMEQTNLVVSSDGRTWDEVTRDTSYLGNIRFHASEDGQNADPIILTDFRGVHRTNGNYYQKKFAIAYDRFICLKAGQYEIKFTTYNNTTTTHSIKINGTAIQSTAMGNTSYTVANATTADAVVSLNRGDYVQISGKWYNQEMSHFSITEV